MTVGDVTVGRQDTQRDRQVEQRAALADVGRRQIDRDPVRGEFEPRVADGAAHAIAAFTHGGVGQPDHRERRHAERHVDLDLHERGFDAEDDGGPQTGEHDRTGAP